MKLTDKAIVWFGLIVLAAAVWFQVGKPRPNTFDASNQQRKPPNDSLIIAPDGRRLTQLRWSLGPPGGQRWPIAPESENKIVHVVYSAEYNNHLFTSDCAAYNERLKRAPERRGAVKMEYSEDVEEHSRAFNFFLLVSISDLSPCSRANASIFMDKTHDGRLSINVYASSPISTQGNPIIHGIFRRHEEALSTTGMKGQLPDKTVGAKPDLFGLHRVGVIADFDKFRNSFGGDYEDLYFSDYSSIDFFIECQVQEIRDSSEDPGWNRHPPCQHFFYYPRLSARVELYYQRIHLKEWASIQARTIQFLDDTLEIHELGANQ